MSGRAGRAPAVAVERLRCPVVELQARRACCKSVRQKYMTGIMRNRARTTGLQSMSCSGGPVCALQVVRTPCQHRCVQLQFDIAHLFTVAATCLPACCCEACAAVIKLCIICFTISQSRNSEMREEVRWHEQQRLLSDFDAAPALHAAVPHGGSGALPDRGRVAGDDGSAEPSSARTASLQYAFSDAPVGLGYSGGGPHGGRGAPGAQGRGDSAANATWSSHNGASQGSYGQDGASAADRQAKEESAWLQGPARASQGPCYAPDQQGVLQGGWQPLQPGSQEAGAEGQGFSTLDGFIEGLSERGYSSGGADAQVEQLAAQAVEAQEGFSQGLGERSRGSGAVDAVVEQLQAARAARRDWAGPGSAARASHPTSFAAAPADAEGGNESSGRAAEAGRHGGGAADLAVTREAASAMHTGMEESGGIEWRAGRQQSGALSGVRQSGEVTPLGFGSGEPGEGDHHAGNQPAHPDPSPAAEGAWPGAWAAQSIGGSLRLPQGTALAQALPLPPVPRFDRRGTLAGAGGAAGSPESADGAAGLDAHPGQGFAEAVEAALRESTALQARSSFPLAFLTLPVLPACLVRMCIHSSCCKHHGVNTVI